MRHGWWQFWSGAAWREWSADIVAWNHLGPTRAELRRRIADKSAAVERARQFEANTKRAIGWIEALRPTPLPIRLIGSETGLGMVTSVTLCESQRSRGKETWCELATGTVYFTNHRMIFEGAKRLAVEYRYLTESRLGPDGFHVAVDGRNYLLTGQSEQLEINLIGAQAMGRGVDPIVLAIDAHREAAKKLANVKTELAWLERELARTARPRRPRSPGWILGSVFLVASLGFIGPGAFTDPVAAASTTPGTSGAAVGLTAN